MVQKKPVGSQKAIPTQKRPVVRGVRPAGAARKQVSQRSGREEVGNRLAWYVGGGLAAIVALLVLIGIYNDRIGPARTTAITVGSHHISLGYYRDRLKANAVDTGDATQVGAFNKESTTTDQLEEEQIYLQRAASLGVSVSDQDVALAMANALHVPVADKQIKDPAVYESAVRAELQRTGLSLDQYRLSAKARTLKDAVGAYFKASVPSPTLAIKGTELLFMSEAQGRAVQGRLGNGDSFNDIAADTTADPTIGHAQPLDWTPVPFGVLPGGLDDVASKLMPGQVSDLIQADIGGTPQWVLLLLTDRDTNHELTDPQKLQIANAKTDDWVSQQKDALGVHSFVDGANARWAAVHTDLPLQAAAKATTPPIAPRPGGAPPAGGPPGAPGAAPPPAGPQPAPAGAPAGPPPPVPNATP